MLAQAELDRITKEVGRAMVRAAGPQWRRVRAEYRAVGRHIEVDLLVTGPDEVPRPVRPPTEVVDGLGRLRAGMYRPGRGTWIGAVYEIEPPGTFSCEFEPDREPPWRRVPPPIGFTDELRSFPRADEYVPDWFRARAGLPPLSPPEPQNAPPPPPAPPVQGTPVRGMPAQTGDQPPRPPQGAPLPAGPGVPPGTPPRGPHQPPPGGRHAAPPPPWENPPPSTGPGRHANGPYRPPQDGFGPPR
ncbi:hypothetical protein CLV40_11846 [Actinokineospora auranticolor]|uniref:Uncharacterized protein n=1 Tax=Actinokineospora auranticolor TaxID=155976 RepID=A0A2S6GHN3_9PSEU|nr:hypothetical protein CLV40_11846 [Actinokineospora auranticolor]